MEEVEKMDADQQAEGGKQRPESDAHKSLYPFLRRGWPGGSPVAGVLPL